MGVEEEDVDEDGDSKEGSLMFRLPLAIHLPNKSPITAQAC